MALVTRSRLFLVFITIASVFSVYYVFFSGKDDDSFSPEQINDMLQNKDKSVRVNKVELPSVGIQQPYVDSSTLQSATWDFSGEVIVKKEYIRLVSDKKNLVGNMFAKMPIQAESFEMELTFHIHSNSKTELIADGMAIWFVDKPLPIGEVFGAQNQFTGLGILIDTYRNGQTGTFPYVMAMVGDGNTKYNKYTDGLDTALGGCAAKKLANPKSELTRMRIVYTRDGYLSVDLNYDPLNTEDWRNCFTLSNVHLPPVKYLGLSSETGMLAENVDIIENKVYALYLPNGGFIESYLQLESLMENQVDNTANTALLNASPSRPRERTKKSVRRLRNAEKRIKQRERALRLELFGDEDATFPVRMWRKMVTMFMYMVYGVVGIVVLWLCRLLYRTRKQQVRNRRGGILAQ